MLTHPSYVRDILEASRNMACVIMEFMRLAKRAGDIEAVEEAARDYVRLADNAMGAMECVFRESLSLGDRSRLPKGGPESPEDYFELLDFVIEVEKVNIERLLRDYPELSIETQERMVGMAKGAIDVLGRYARWVRSVVKSRHPGLWTGIHEARYGKYLDIRPLF